MDELKRLGDMGVKEECFRRCKMEEVFKGAYGVWTKIVVRSTGTSSFEMGGGD